ncbi:uncharacterized protein LOC123013814 [Tribolium madens]|uniref:uncharacterized protein LOC123013814 n=1 Tax=Tribolium madens TaxID=41895 RepID=UPI001CF75F5C|nr:uncharacterized protein LOC123013814 [Tribolium madens]XP_044268546.1 uncharacterized protein LOC123013814 [Tribolium madens]
MQETQTIIVTFTLSTVFVGIGIAFFIVSDNFTSECYFRMTVTFLAGMTTFMAAMWTGQLLESNWDEITMVLKEVKWYNFNHSNKKLYLFFLTTMMKKRKIQLTENYSVNYQLGLAVVRGVYSVISVVLNKRA